MLKTLVPSLTSNEACYLAFLWRVHAYLEEISTKVSLKESLLTIVRELAVNFGHLDTGVGVGSVGKGIIVGSGWRVDKLTPFQILASE